MLPWLLHETVDIFGVLLHDSAVGSSIFDAHEYPCCIEGIVQMWLPSDSVWALVNFETDCY
jgi:hypothetical protein